MQRWLALASLELRQLVRARSALVLLAAFVLAVVLATDAGTRRVASERALFATREAFLTRQAEALSVKHAKELGLMFYHLAMPTEQLPNAWTALATGLRDIHPVSQHLRFLGLVPQAYASELGSPLHQLTGSFDYAFVITFLLPLLVIALSFDVASRDEALGIDLLVRAQPARRSRLIMLRLALRALLVLVAALLSFAAVMLYNDVPLDVRAGGWVSALTLYILFWSALTGVIASLGRGSQWSLLATVGAWIALSIALPAIANAVIDSGRREQGVALTLRQREVLNAGYDKPRAAVMTPFITRRPAYQGVQVPEDFSWPWFYANQEVADTAVSEQVASYRSATASREHDTSWVAAWLPSLAVQRALTRFAATDLAARLAYQDSLARHHERLKGFLYPLLFTGQPVSAVAFDAIPRHSFARAPMHIELRELVGLAAMALLLALAASRTLRRLDR